MSFGADFIREYLALALLIARKRWWMFMVPILLAIPVAFVALKVAPIKYSANSLILLQAANRSTGLPGSTQISNALEQVQAIGAWVKSDQVLTELLPQLSGYGPAASPGELQAQMKRLAASLTLELAGSSVLQIKLEGGSPNGLGRDLEVILSRIMEGLTGPERNVFSAPQFLVMYRTEDVTLAESRLMRALDTAGIQNPNHVRSALHQIWATMRKSTERNAANTGASSDPAIDQLRRSISSDPATVARLESLYAAYQTALEKHAAVEGQPTGRSNYVTIFNSPDDLLILGRPKDPLFGESSGRKFAVGILLLSVMMGAGLVLLAEILQGRLRTRRDHESAAGLPVVARLPYIRSPQPDAA